MAVKEGVLCRLCNIALQLYKKDKEYYAVCLLCGHERKIEDTKDEVYQSFINKE